MSVLANLMAPIVSALLMIVFWELGRGIVKRFSLKKTFFYRKRPFACEKEKVLGDISREAKSIMGQGHFVSMLIKDRILREARQEADKILQEAKKEIAIFQKEAMKAFQKEMVSTSFMINQQVMKNVDEYLSCSYKTSPNIIQKYLENHPYRTQKPTIINKV